MMNPAILHDDVQNFINENIGADVTRIILNKSPFANVSSAELAEQIAGKKRCEKKLPLWFNTDKIYYPSRLSVEQASSEATAAYKSRLVKGNKVLDLTGGFGVDSFFFSRRADEVTHCELNKNLSAIAKHNCAVLGATNMHFITKNGLEYLQASNEQFDTIYIDPSRRVNSRKVFMLKDCEPNIPENFNLLLSKSKRLIIKTAPLLDIQAGLNELRYVSEIHVISVKNDCKELLWIIDGDFKGPEPQIICAAIEDNCTQLYRFNYSEERKWVIENYSKPLQFIFEPDVALLKAGCFKLITRDFEVLKLHQHTHLYTSEQVRPNFIGRKFKLVQYWGYKQFIKNKAIQQANIICRNFPLSTQEVKKKHKLKDGGTDYLLFTTGPKDELLVLHCRRLQ